MGAAAQAHKGSPQGHTLKTMLRLEDTASPLGQNKAKNHSITRWGCVPDSCKVGQQEYDRDYIPARDMYSDMALSVPSTATCSFPIGGKILGDRRQGYSNHCSSLSEDSTPWGKLHLLTVRMSYQEGLKLTGPRSVSDSFTTTGTDEYPGACSLNQSRVTTTPTL